MSHVQMRAEREGGRARCGAAGMLALAVAAAAVPVIALGCSDESGSTEASLSGGGANSSSQSNGSAGGGSSSGTSGGGGSGGSGGIADPGPNVDTSDPRLLNTSFKANEADPAATEVLGMQLAFLDTRTAPRGILVVYLHGAETPSTCGSIPHGEMLAGLGFHVLSPCYLSNYGVGNCGDDVRGCRLEAFEGVDHHPFIDVDPSDSVETRVVKGLAYVQSKLPEGDWTYFVDGDKPRWSKILISGISHGASSSALIGKLRRVHRVVSLSGPLDANQAWLGEPSLTPIEDFFAFSHTGDVQHPGHLGTFEVLGFIGQPTLVDDASPPYGGSHRLISSADTSDGHGSTQAGSSSPKAGNEFVYQPVWTTMYVGEP